MSISAKQIDAVLSPLRSFGSAIKLVFTWIIIGIIAIVLFWPKIIPYIHATLGGCVAFIIMLATFIAFAMLAAPDLWRDAWYNKGLLSPAKLVAPPMKQLPMEEMKEYGPIPSVDWWRKEIVSRNSKQPTPIAWSPEYGLIEVDFDVNPHWLISGKTGTGKTRRVLKPLALAAAMQGHLVIILDGDNGLDMGCLDSHPNIWRIQFDTNTIDEAVELIANETADRKAKMGEYQVSRVKDMPKEAQFPRMVVLFDEYAATLAMMQMEGRKDEAKSVNAGLAATLSTARKANLNIITVVQRPTTDVITGLVRSQMEPMCMRVRDQYEAKAAMAPGAEELTDGQVYIYTDEYGNVLCDTWHPSNEHIEKIIGKFDGPVIDAPQWVRTAKLLEPAFYNRQKQDKNDHNGQNQELSVLVLHEQIDDFLKFNRQSKFDDLTIGEALAISHCLQNDLSMTKTCEMVFGFKNGIVFEKVATIKKAMNG